MDMSLWLWPAWVWAIAGFLLGTIIGSFLATILVRWPRGQSVLTGRSACDGCGRALGPLELIPLVSALALRGQCRTCGETINHTHFWMECAAGLIGACTFAAMPGVEGLGWAIFGWLLLTLAMLDWRHMWLPDALTLPLAFLGFTLGLWVTDISLQDRIIGAAAGCGSLLAIALGYRALRGREGLGLGDAKLLGAIGAWLGWQALPFLLLIASVTALLVVGVMALRGRGISATTQVPLGTFLCIAAFPAWITTRAFGL